MVADGRFELNVAGNQELTILASSSAAANDLLLGAIDQPLPRHVSLNRGPDGPVVAAVSKAAVSDTEACRIAGYVSRSDPNGVSVDEHPSTGAPVVLIVAVEGANT